MIYQLTARWIIDASPYTGEAKTLTTRMRRMEEYVAEADSAGAILLVRRAWPETTTGIRVGGGSAVYRVGQTYEVQPGRGLPGLATIRVTGIAAADHAGDVSNDEVLAEGFATRQQFHAALRELHGRRALDRPAWRIAFALERVAPWANKALQVLDDPRPLTLAERRAAITRLRAAYEAPTRA